VVFGLLAPCAARAGGSITAIAVNGAEWLFVAALLLAAAAGAWFAGRHAGRRAERAGRQLRSVLEFADCLLWQADVDAAAWKWTWTVQPTGLSRRLFAGLPRPEEAGLWPRAHTPELDEMEARCREALQSGQAGYEEQFRFVKDGRTFWLRQSVSITPAGPNRFWLVGLVTDITVQREAEQARRTSEDRVRQLLAQADCMLWQARVRLDERDEFQWEWFIPKSELYRRIIGEMPAVPRMLWESSMVPEYAEIEKRSRAAMLEGLPGYEQEFRVVSASGVLWLHEQVSVRSVAPREWKLEGVIIDLTAQRRAEESKRASEAQLQQVIDAADFLLWHARVFRRPDGELHWVLNVPGSKLYRQLFGKDPDEPAALAWHSLVSPETYDEMMARCTAAILGGKDGYEQEFRAKQNEQIFWLHEKATVRQIAPGEWRVVGLLTDATMRHEAEQARQASERALREVLARADCLVWEAQVELSADGGWNWTFEVQPSGLCELLFGVAVPPREAGLWRRFDIPERGEMDERARSALAGGAPGYEQIFHVVREGRATWLHESVSIKRTGPQRFSLVGVATNITAQHLAEEARQASERALREILERANCLLWRASVIRRNGTIDWVRFELPASRLYSHLLGDVNNSHANQLWDPATVPELAEMNARSHDALVTGAAGYEQEFRVVRAGRTFWLHEQVTIMPVGSDEWRIVGVVTDITARREAEEAQRKSEARLEELLRRADCMIWQGRVTRTERDELAWELYMPRSQLHRRIFGRDPRGASFGWNEIGVPEHPAMQARARGAILGGEPGYEQVFHIPSPQGDVWVSEQVTINRVGPDQWEVVGVITDITARREAEEARRATEAQLQKILEMADCMVWEATTVERAGGGLDWQLYTPRSVLYRRLFGENEMSGSLDWNRLNVPEMAEIDGRAERAIRDGAPGYAQEFRVIFQDRGVVWLREVVTISPLTQGRARLVGVITDITAQREAQEAHRVSEAQVEQMLATVDCLLWQARVFKLGPRELRWVLFVPRSRLYREIFGVDPGDPPELRWDLLVDPATNAEINGRAVASVLSGASGYEQEFRAPRGAREFWLHEQVSITPVGPGEWKLVGVITDLTARRAAEQAVRESELRYRTLFQHTPVAIVEADFSAVGRWLEELRAAGVTDLAAQLDADPQSWLHGAKLVRFVDCNTTAETMLRAKSKSDFRRRRGMLATPDSLRVIRAVTLALWEGRNSLESEIDMKDFAGALHHMHVRWWMERTESGLDLRQSVMVFVDLTELREAEAALAAEKERLAVTLRAMAEGVITTDVNGCVQYLNPAAAAFTLRDGGDAIGRPVAEICHFENDRTGERVELPVGRVARCDVVLELPAQTKLVVPNGAGRLVEGCCAPIHAADSTVIGTVLVFRDVTEHERLEQELVRATKLESVGILAGGIAHDFNNILTAVMGNVALALLDIDPESEPGHSLREAEKATLRARDLTQQLLTFAKGGEPVRASVRLDGIVREMTTFTLHGSRVKAVFEIPDNLWPADADKGQIGRVVQNLVINAVQAMPEGGAVRVTLTNVHVDGLTRPALAPGDYVQITIADTGVGIKPEHLPRIFDPYFTTKQMGSGLGLAAVYSIVNKHRGAVDVDSQLGNGTTFRIWLPAAREEVAATAAAAPARGNVALKGRVLFMDDEESIREMAAFLLRRFGFEVVCVADGAEAVKRYDEAQAAGDPFVLVIMDLTVPGGMGGRETIAQLRSIDPKVKAIVSSGYSSDPVLANYREHGFCGVAAKPYEVADLARVLREALAE